MLEHSNAFKYDEHSTFILICRVFYFKKFKIIKKYFY